MSKSKKKPIVIKNQEEAESAVKRCQEIDLDLEYWRQCEERAIQKVREKFDAKREEGNAAGLENERKTLVKALRKYAEIDRQNWNKQSLVLRYGSLVFHAGQPAVGLIREVCKSVDAVIARLKRIANCPYIRTEEKLDKESILRDYADGAIDNAYLDSVGLQVERKESFSVKTNAEQSIKSRLDKRAA